MLLPSRPPGVERRPPRPAEFHAGAPATQVWTTRQAASSTTRSAAAPDSSRPRSDRPRASAGVVAHSRAASTTSRPTGPTSLRKAPSIVRMLPARVPSASTAQRSVTRIGWSPSTLVAPTRQPGAGGRVGDRQHAVDALGAHRHPHHRRMHVEAVADHLARDRVVGEHRAGQPGRPVRQRRHPVEQMRGMARAGVDRRPGPARRSRPSGRATRGVRRHQPGDEVERPSSSGASVTRRTEGRCASITATMAAPVKSPSWRGGSPGRGGSRRQAAGCAPL